MELSKRNTHLTKNYKVPGHCASRTRDLLLSKRLCLLQTERVKDLMGRMVDRYRVDCTSLNMAP
jgi:hypothetical protein